MEYKHEAARAIDAISISVVGATLIGYLPAIAAVLSIIWTAIRIYESDTVRCWLGLKK